MKSIIVFIVLVALCVTSVKAVEVEKVQVYKGQQGYQLINPKITLTPFSVEKGVRVTNDELNFIISGGKLFRDSKEERHWINPYTLSISSKSTEHIALVGTTVRKVKETVVEKRKSFNSFFLLGTLYIILVFYIPYVVRAPGGKVTLRDFFVFVASFTAIGNLIFNNEIVASNTSTGGTLAVITLGVIAFMAAGSQVTGKHVWWKSIVGIIAMVVMMAIVYF